MTATISHMRMPIANLAVMPMPAPIPAPMPKRMDSFGRRPADNSSAQAPRPAPVQVPISVPRTGIGIAKVPTTAPVRAPMMAPIEPRHEAPAFFAPPAPAKNSISSPIIAKMIIAARVYVLKTFLSPCHHANRQAEITMSQFPGSAKTTSASHTAFSMISKIDQK